MTDEIKAASDGGVCMINRTAYASQHGESFRTARNEHPVSCAGCDCEPGTVCDTQKRCECGHSKTACDAFLSKRDGNACCTNCQHDG